MKDLDVKIKMIVSWILGLWIMWAAVFDYFQMTTIERVVLFLIGVFIILVF